MSPSSDMWQEHLKRASTTLLPAVLIAAAMISLLGKQVPPGAPPALPGRPLAAFADLYPVRAAEDGRLFLDKERFRQAVDYLSLHPEPKAISDLIYLGQSNSVTLLLSEDDKKAYQKLVERPENAPGTDVERQRDMVFHVYRDIVDGIGQTFAGTGMEIVLHDVRNPLKSIVALQNPISGRRLGDPTTNFGLELIRDYSLINKPAASFIAYPLKTTDGRAIKSTTIPLYDSSLGLIGFICLNIDISNLNREHPEASADFLRNFVAVNDSQKVREMIEAARSQTTPNH